MREQEIQDFELCQRAVANGSPDPERRLLMPRQMSVAYMNSPVFRFSMTVAPASYELEEIPVAVPLYYRVHNKTPSPAETFLFSGQEMKKYPPHR